jgi:hypothetical protein
MQVSSNKNMYADSYNMSQASVERLEETHKKLQKYADSGNSSFLHDDDATPMHVVPDPALSVEGDGNDPAVEHSILTPSVVLLVQV